MNCEICGSRTLINYGDAYTNLCKDCIDHPEVKTLLSERRGQRDVLEGDQSRKVYADTLESTYPATIFVSYRRIDTAEIVGRLNDRLKQHFGSNAIFHDVDSIPLGVDFRQYINQVIESCDIFIAIIGDQWLNVHDQAGEQRINSPTDHVRLELESALDRKIPVIPILVRKVSMPLESDLPISLQPLCYRNAIAIRSDPDFHRDVDRLIGGIEALLKTDRL